MIMIALQKKENKDRKKTTQFTSEIRNRICELDFICYIFDNEVAN